MLERKAYNDLLNWKKNRNQNKITECLSLRGPRQVGKTTLVEMFGRKEYKSFIEINFAYRSDLKAIFNGNLDKEEIYKKLVLYFPDVNFIDGETLIFLDEIQKCSNARTALKVMAQDFRYDVITSGSLLGLIYSENDDKEVDECSLLPVGYERIYYLYSLDFEEFLWSQGLLKNNINLLKEEIIQAKSIDKGIVEKYQNLFREYIVIGGMPEVILKFNERHNYYDAFDMQNKIIENYKEDIAFHAVGSEKIKVRKCFDSLPAQLSKEIKKFQYSVVEKNQTSKKYGDSVQWLIDSNLVLPSYNVHEAYIPLVGEKKVEQFKLYFHDTGLLTALYGKECKIAIMANTLTGNVKGGIYENIIGETLYKLNFNLFYYHPSDNEEIEFLIERDGKVIPIEVKASNNASASLNRFLKNNVDSYGYKVIDGNFGINERKIVIPHFALSFILSKNT